MTNKKNEKKKFRKKKLGNQGFSLVELIIVIAITAILVGVIAPMLIKILEKSRVAADRGMLDAVCAAITYSSVERRVQDDAASVNYLKSCISSPTALESVPTDCVLYEAILDKLGWEDLSAATYRQKIKSAHTSSSQIFIQYKGGVENPIALWITYTDSEAERDTSEQATNYTTIVKNIAIN